MAKNISLLGADYPDVPAVTLPQTGGGTATFYDVEVTDGDPTLAWGTRSKVGTVNGTDLHVTMPSNPASASDGNPTLAWGTQSTVGTVNGTALHVKMPANPIYSVEITATTDSDGDYVWDSSTYYSTKINVLSAIYDRSYNNTNAYVAGIGKSGNANNNFNRYVFRLRKWSDNTPLTSANFKIKVMYTKV